MRKKVSRVVISMCAAASMVLSVVAPAMTVAAETTDEPVELTVWSWDKTMNGTTFEVADSLDVNVTVNVQSRLPSENSYCTGFWRNR